MKRIHFGTIFTAVSGLFVSSMAFAQEGAQATQGGGWSLTGLGVGLGVGLAALGGGMGQGKLVAAALEGVTRNPQSAKVALTPMILGLAFVESLVLLVWLLFFILGVKG